MLDIGSNSRWAQRAISEEHVYWAIDYPATSTFYNSTPHIFGDAQALPFKSSSVETVLLFEVLEHLPDPARALRESHRVLKDGGHLLLSVPFLHPIHDSPFDFRRFTKHGLELELSQAGFDEHHIQGSSNTFDSSITLLNITIASVALDTDEKVLVRVLFFLLSFSIPILNILGWLASKISRRQEFLTAGYIVIAKKIVTKNHL